MNSADTFVCKVVGDCKQKQTALPHSVEQRGTLKNNATVDASVPDNDASRHSYLLPNKSGFCPASDDECSANTIRFCSPLNCHCSNHVPGHFQSTFPEIVSRHAVYTLARPEYSVFCGPQRSRCRSCFFACNESV